MFVAVTTRTNCNTLYLALPPAAMFVAAILKCTTVVVVAIEK